VAPTTFNRVCYSGRKKFEVLDIFFCLVECVNQLGIVLVNSIPERCCFLSCANNAVAGCVQPSKTEVFIFFNGPVWILLFGIIRLGIVLGFFFQKGLGSQKRIGLLMSLELFGESFLQEVDQE
jgi:hypothetical protein